MKLNGTTVLEAGWGADVVMRTDPFPVADIGVSNVPLEEIVAESPGEGVMVVEV